MSSPMDINARIESTREPWRKGSSSSHIPAQAPAFKSKVSGRLSSQQCPSTAVAAWGEKVSTVPFPGKFKVPKITTSSGGNLWVNSSF